MRLLLAPYAAGLALLIALPALLTFGLAFFDWDLLTDPEWAGLSNFEQLFDDPVFREALGNSLAFMAIAVPLRMLAATGMALLLHRRMRAAGAVRTVTYLPTVVPEIAYALAWLFLLNPVYGPVNALLGWFGLGTPAWLSDPTAAMAAIVLMSVFTIGEGFIVALAARRELPAELDEVAALEGSSAWNTLRRVTLPLMAPTLGLLALRDAAITLQVSFVPALVVTGGGPDRATTFLPNLVYSHAFENLRYGYAAAITLVMFAITGLALVAALMLMRRRRYAFSG